MSMASNLDAIRLGGVGRYRPGGVDDEELNDDFEDSTRARRPSEAGSIPINDEVVSRFRDILIVKLHRRGVSVRNIGRILNISGQRVHQLLGRLPAPMRSYYERLELV